MIPLTESKFIDLQTIALMLQELKVYVSGEAS